MNKNTFKNIGAVLAGIIVIIVLSILTDILLEEIGVFPSPDQGLFIPWMLALALLYRSAYAVVGGYVTALLSPTKPMRQVMILNGIGIVMGTLGVVAGWNLSQHWYPISLVFTSAFGVWLGGKLKTR